MDYGEVLSRAWKIIWRNKVLWIFGIMASFGEGGGGGNGGSNYSTNSGQTSFNVLPPGWADFFSNVARFFENIQWWGWVIMVAGIFILMVFAAALATIGEAGLVRGTKLTEDTAEKLRFGPLFSESKHYFWRIFLLKFLAGVVIFILVILLLLPFIVFVIATEVDIAVLWVFIAMFFLLLCCLIVPISWVLSIIIRQSINAIVVEDVGIFAGLKRGWLVCRRHPGPNLVMALILGIGAGIVNLVISIPAMLAFLPILFHLISGNLEGLTSAAVISLVLCCAYLPVLYLLSGILTAFTHSAWALTYLRLTRPPADMPLMPVEILPESKPER